MMSSNRMEVTHQGHVGQVRRHVLEVAQLLGADETRSGAAAIVASELATNLLKHGQGGEIILLQVKEPISSLEILALDKGPGMVNVSACLRDGYSTAGSAGTGLGAVQRMAKQFQIQSQPGKGTALWVSLSLGSEAPHQGQSAPRDKARAFETSGVSLAVRGEELCGDSWDVSYSGTGMRVVVADGLGHGPFAEEASREAIAIFRQNPSAGPVLAMRQMHDALTKTRGAAASMAAIEHSEGQLRMAGIGNVLMRLHRASGSKTLAGDNGTLGAAIRRVNEINLPWEEDSLLIIHSDGIGSHWNLNDYPGLIRRHPGLIAGVLYRDYNRAHDDATVVVVRRQD